MNLSKSDFILASSCAKKLVYKKKGYASSNDTDEYMAMLAQGGYVIGKMATLLYSDGIEIEGTTNEAVEITNKLIAENKDVVLFEPAFLFEQRLSRVDIFVKEGNEIKVIEVKSKSYDPNLSDSKNGLDPYIEDVAYQFTIVKDLFPDYNVKAYLLMPDKTLRTNIDGLAGWFRINEPMSSNDLNEAPEEIITQEKVRFKKPEVEFVYENSKDRSKYIEGLKKNGILNLYEVTKQVNELEKEIRNRASEFIHILNNGLKCEVSVDKNCKTCEYYVKGDQSSGFFECWKHTKEFPGIFDMYYGGDIAGDDDKYLNNLIAERKYNFSDIDINRLQTKNGKIGPRAARQRIQLENTLKNKEWFSPHFTDALKELKYPLHFIDFETYTGAIPFNKGMHPYELIAFQWSCHTVEKQGAEPIHNEWIHTEEGIPNFEFAESLMNRIGERGTVLMWATHENTVLRRIYYQMEEYGVENEKLEKWLRGIIKDNDLGLEGRLVDMNKLTLEQYFHPEMKGKTSIKKVLPAIWNNNNYLHDIPWFKSYAGFTEDAEVIDPYDTLFKEYHAQDDEENFSQVEQVQGGTAAMRAYHHIRFDENYSDAQKKELRSRLLNYCKLDTMAMVIIYTHWIKKLRM